MESVTHSLQSFIQEGDGRLRSGRKVDATALSRVVAFTNSKHSRCGHNGSICCLQPTFAGSRRVIYAHGAASVDSGERP